MIVLNLNESNLQELEILKTTESNSVIISCENATHETIDLIINVLKDFGSALTDLKLKLTFPSDPYKHDLTEFDFAASCPNLENLNLERCDVNESVLKHPAIKKLKLKKSWLHTSHMVQIGVDADSAIEYLELGDCNWCNEEKESVSKLTIGERSALKEILYSIDEDDAECSIKNFEICNTPALEKLYLNVHLNFSLELIGNIPKLAKITARSGRFASHNLDFTKVEDGSSAYLVDIRNGKGECFGHVYVFMGEGESFDQDKLKALIVVLGGKIQSTINENVTHVCLFGDYSEEWISEELSIDELVNLQSLIDDGQEIEVMDEEYVSDYFIDWY